MRGDDRVRRASCALKSGARILRRLALYYRPMSRTKSRFRATQFQRDRAIHFLAHAKRYRLDLSFYNGRRPHSSLDGMTPDRAYCKPLPLRLAA